VVQQGETLPLIAHDAYGDVRQWPVIAEFNDISDVREVEPGTVLMLPPTR
jgi:nucleoid-associated protein YgaU